ncbi:MAG: DUF4383 domain-containing protein [Actinomycetota bacterium]
MSATALPQTARLQSQRWSPARIYLVVSGVFLLLLAGAGFLVNRDFPTSPSEVAGGSSLVGGLLLTNGWHNLAGLLSGLIALGFAVRPEWARTGALFKGLFYVGVTSSLLITDARNVLLASNWADQIVHASLAVGGLATGLATPRPGRSRASG